MITLLLRTIRPSFLALTPACVALGASIALTSMHSINISLLLLISLGALSAHACLNLLNEYYDFKSGIDLHTHKTAFNGGSGVLPAYPQMALLVLGIGLIMMVLTITIGVYFIYESGISILLIGLIGMLLIITYTQWLSRLPVISLLAPGLGFGILMVLGTHNVLAGQSSLLALAIALVPFFLVNNVVLINQYPDIDADRAAGRNNCPIAFGLQKSTRIYIGFSVIAYGLIIVYALAGWLPILSLIALIPLPLTVITAYGAIKYGEHIGEHLPLLAANMTAAVLVPILIAMSIFIAY